MFIFINRKIEPTETIILNDRIEFNRKLLNKNSELFVESQKKVNENKDVDMFKEVYKNYFEVGGFKIMDIITWDGKQELTSNPSRYVSFSIATREMAEKIIDIAYMDGSQYVYDEETFKSWDVKISNVIINLKLTFRELFQQWTDELLVKIVDYSKSQKNSYLIIVLCTAAAIIVSTLTFIPFLIKSQQIVQIGRAHV